MRAGLLLTGLVLVAAAGCGSPPPAEEMAPAGPVAPWRGDEAEPADPQAVRPFTIDVPEAVLDDLRLRLARTRLPDEIDGAGWDYGLPRDYLTELITYWRDEYDWRAQEAALNAFDHFKTRIGDIDVHFIHQRSPEPDALPLIITDASVGEGVGGCERRKPGADDDHPLGVAHDTGGNPAVAVIEDLARRSRPQRAGQDHPRRGDRGELKQATPGEDEGRLRQGVLHERRHAPGESSRVRRSASADARAASRRVSGKPSSVKPDVHSARHMIE